jgi:hypothetical protein
MSDLRKRAGRGLWRAVYASLVDHEDFRALTPHARLLFFVLRLGSATTIASIFHYYTEVLQAQTGLSSRQLASAFQELEQRPSQDRPWIVRDRSVVWIRNGLRFDPNLSMNNENHVLAIRRAVAALPRRSAVVQRFIAYYTVLGPLGDDMGVSHGVSHAPSHAPSLGGITTPTPTPTPETTPDPVSLSLGKDQHQDNGYRYSRTLETAADVTTAMLDGRLTKQQARERLQELGAASR